jgi:hypothetical protein
MAAAAHHTAPHLWHLAALADEEEHGNHAPDLVPQERRPVYRKLPHPQRVFVPARAGREWGGAFKL